MILGLFLYFLPVLLVLNSCYPILQSPALSKQLETIHHTFPWVLFSLCSLHLENITFPGSSLIWSSQIHYSYLENNVANHITHCIMLNIEYSEQMFCLGDEPGLELSSYNLIREQYCEGHAQGLALARLSGNLNVYFLPLNIKAK